MFVDHVRDAHEFNAAPLEIGICGLDVRDLEVQDRLLAAALRFGKEQPRSITIEERELAERVEVRQSEHLLVPALGFANVAHGAGDLTERTKLRSTHDRL